MQDAAPGVFVSTGGTTARSAHDMCLVISYNLCAVTPRVRRSMVRLSRTRTILTNQQRKQHTLRTFQALLLRNDLNMCTVTIRGFHSDRSYPFGVTSPVSPGYFAHLNGLAAREAREAAVFPLLGGRECTIV